MDEPIALAGCILTDDYGRLLLLHRTSASHWELPGGKVEDDESPAAAAVREIREELGVNAELVKALGNETFEDGGETYIFHWFLATTAQTPQIMEPDLFDDLDYIDIEDLASLSLSANMLVLEEKLLTGEVTLQP